MGSPQPFCQVSCEQPSTPGWFYSYIEACASTRDWEGCQESHPLGQRSCGTCARHSWDASFCLDPAQPHLLHSAAPPGNLPSIDVGQKGSAAGSLPHAPLGNFQAGGRQELVLCPPLPRRSLSQRGSLLLSARLWEQTAVLGIGSTAPWLLESSEQSPVRKGCLQQGRVGWHSFSLRTAC